MSASKAGDLVHVAYDAVVVRLLDDGEVKVQPVDCISFETVPVDWCTVIVPPIEVGDIVTEANIGQLPFGSIAAQAGRSGGYPFWRGNKYWTRDGQLERDERCVIGCTVLRIGGGE